MISDEGHGGQVAPVRRAVTHARERGGGESEGASGRGCGEQRRESAEGEGASGLSSRQLKASLAHKGSKAAKQQLEEVQSRHTLKMDAFVPANNNPGLSSLRSTVLLKRAARGLGRFVVRFRFALCWSLDCRTGTVADWSGAAHARNAMEYGPPSGCAALE